MSQLLGHIKALRALATAYGQEHERLMVMRGTSRDASEELRMLALEMNSHCRVHLNAAQALEEQAKRESSAYQVGSQGPEL